MSNPLNSQVGGDHYKKLKIQPAEYAHANGLGLLAGNVVKYVTRFRDKDGIKDLRKAIHCTKLLIKLEYDVDEVDPVTEEQKAQIIKEDHHARLGDFVERKEGVKHASITPEQFEQMWREMEDELRSRRSSHHVSEDVKAKWYRTLFGGNA